MPDVDPVLPGCQGWCRAAWPLLTYALPYLAVQARIELAHAHLTLGDPAGARLGASTRSQAVTQARQLGLLDG